MWNIQLSWICHFKPQTAKLVEYHYKSMDLCLFGPQPFKKSFFQYETEGVEMSFSPSGPLQVFLLSPPPVLVLGSCGPPPPLPSRNMNRSLVCAAILFAPSRLSSEFKLSARLIHPLPAVGWIQMPLLASIPRP